MSDASFLHKRDEVPPDFERGRTGPRRTDMADIISFELWASCARSQNRQPKGRLPRGWSAEIIIFPGVRIERHDDEITVAGVKGRR